MPKVLSVVSLDIQQFMFKLAMTSNVCTTMVKPLNVNHFTLFWCILSTSKVLACEFFEYFKSVEIAMVQMFGSVEDEWCFSSLAFCESKLCNRLTTNPSLTVWMFSQKFSTLHNFLDASTYEEWHVEYSQYGVGVQI